MRAADLLGGALDVEPRGDPLHQPQDDPEVLHVRPHRLGDARVLHLDRDVAPVVQPRAVDLADRGGGDRLGLERREDLLDRLVELGLDDLLHVREADLRRRVAQLAELALELLAVLLGHEPDVEEAHDLPELHRRALHRPERRDDLLGRLEVAALERRLLALVAAAEVGRARAEVARGLARRRGRTPERCARCARSGSGPWPWLGRRRRGRGGGRRRRRGRRRGTGVSVGVGVGRRGRPWASPRGRRTASPSASARRGRRAPSLPPKRLCGRRRASRRRRTRARSW